VNLYCKFNDFDADPLGEDPTTRERNREMQARLQRLTFEEVRESMAIIGTPVHCIERIRWLQEGFRLSELICWFNPGGLMPHQTVLASMSRFAARIMPNFRWAPLSRYLEENTMPVINHREIPEVEMRPGIRGQFLAGAGHGARGVCLLVNTVDPGATAPLHKHTVEETMLVLDLLGDRVAPIK
jgi:hypothetical protein